MAKTSSPAVPGPGPPSAVEAGRTLSMLERATRNRLEFGEIFGAITLGRSVPVEFGGQAPVTRRHR